MTSLFLTVRGLNSAEAVAIPSSQKIRMHSSVRILFPFTSFQSEVLYTNVFFFSGIPVSVFTAKIEIYRLFLFFCFQKYPFCTLKRITGVGEVTLLGSNYGMRIWLKPDVMAQYGVVPGDVTSALNAQNIESATGSFGENYEGVFHSTR